MECAIEFEGWRVMTGLITEKQGEALALAANDLSAKEASRVLGITAAGVQQRLDDARYNLGMLPSVRAMLVYAMKKGILAPLALALLIGSGHQEAPAQRRPGAPRTYAQLRIARKVEDCQLAA